MPHLSLSEAATSAMFSSSSSSEEELESSSSSSSSDVRTVLHADCACAAAAVGIVVCPISNSEEELSIWFETGLP